MEKVKFDFDRDIVPAVTSRARLVFCGKQNYQDLLNDALSLAWEAIQTAPLQVRPKSIAYYSCVGAMSGRQFSRSERSLDGPNLKRKFKPFRDTTVKLFELPSGKKDSPAELAAVRVDFGAWLQTLTTREKDFLLGFLYGESTGSIAKRMQCTPARVSQMRRELVEHWMMFTS